MRGLTKEFINEELLRHDKGIVLIGDYTNCRTKTTFRCEHGHEWSTVASSVLRGRGCPECSSIQLTKDKVNEILSADGRGILMIGEYINNKTKTRFKCNLGHEWDAITTNVMIRKTGCPHCSKTTPITEEMFKNFLQDDDRGITLVGNFVNRHTKTFVKCKCGNEWGVTPRSIMRGSGCPNCTIFGFKEHKPAWVYVLDFGIFIKYGITNDLNRRLNEHLKNGKYTTVFTKRYGTGREALTWENNIKQTYGGNFVNKDVCPDGYTETLPKSILQEILS